MKKYILLIVLLIIVIILVITMNNYLFPKEENIKSPKAPVINIYIDEKLELDGISLYSEINSNEIFIHTYKIKKEDKVMSIPISYGTDIAKFILRAEKKNVVIAEHKFTMDKSYIDNEKIYDVYLKQDNEKIYDVYLKQDNEKIYFKH